MLCCAARTCAVLCGTVHVRASRTSYSSTMLRHVMCLRPVHTISVKLAPRPAFEKRALLEGTSAEGQRTRNNSHRCPPARFLVFLFSCPFSRLRHLCERHLQWRWHSPLLQREAVSNRRYAISRLIVNGQKTLLICSFCASRADTAAGQSRAERAAASSRVRSRFVRLHSRELLRSKCC